MAVSSPNLEQIALFRSASVLREESCRLGEFPIPEPISATFPLVLGHLEALQTSAIVFAIADKAISFP